MAPIWTGALSFGLVHIPVRLHSAVRASEEIHFRLLHAKDLAPVKYERICTHDGDVVPWSDIVKGYELHKNEFVVLTEADFDAVASAASKVLEIIDFVRAEEIDPRYFEKPYYVVPQKGGEKAYALLRDAMRRSGMVGIGTFAMRQKEQLASIKPVGDALVLEVLHFPNELVDPGELTFPGEQALRPQELQMAEQLIQNLAEPFDPTRYEDRYRERLMAVIEAKAAGRTISRPGVAEPKGTKVVDLMARLEESLARSRGGRTGARSARGKRAHVAAPAAAKRGKSSTARRAKKSA